MMIEHAAEELDIPPPGPPDYLGADTCGECWEPFTSAVIDRWLHRRKWGHNPTSVHPLPTAVDLHARNVEGARRYRGYPPAPPPRKETS